MATQKLLLLPGDGIGPEVMTEVQKLVTWMNTTGMGSFETESDLVGGSAYDAHKVAITDAAMILAHESDAVIFGAVGGPKWDKVPYEARPEAGLLRLRKDLELFANLRPAICYPALADASSLKRDLVEGLDIVIVRELTGGVYFELARKRKNKVTSSEKRNVMRSGVLWNEVITDLHKREYPDVMLEHQLADALGMQLVRWPKQFDVIVTDNLFGDMLSDVAAMLTGSLGMLPSAALGAENEKTGKRKAMYEPVHGSAPDIAGKGLANPIAMFGSFAMTLRYSFGMTAEADMLERAISDVLDQGLRTKDIASPGQNAVSTTEMGEAVLKQLQKLAG